MKRISLLIITILITLSVFTITVSAKYTISADDVSTDISDSISDSGYVNIEPELKKTRWIYYLLGGLSTAGVITAAVVITKKKD